MGRIRTIKPEFPLSESIGKLTRDARLLFIQLWTIADDQGRARAASRALAGRLYPYDDDAPKLIDRWLEELERGRLIRRYVVEGSSYLEISKWLKHQKIDKPSKSRLPAFDEGSPNPREPSRTLDDGPRTLDLDLGPKDLDPPLASLAGESPAPAPSPAAAPPQPKQSRATRLSKDWQPTDADREEALKLGLANEEEINFEADKFRDYWIARATGATKLDWSAAWRNWVRKAVAEDHGRRPYNTNGAINGQRSHRRSALEGADALRKAIDQGFTFPDRPL
jgi:hypothetical protein